MVLRVLHDDESKSCTHKMVSKPLYKLTQGKVKVNINQHCKVFQYLYLIEVTVLSYNDITVCSF